MQPPLPLKRRLEWTNEEEFLGSLSEIGIRVYERVLALGRQEGMHIKWTKSGFSLYVVLDRRHFVICYGYGHDASKYNQSIYTAFDSISTRTNVPQEVVEQHRRDALAIGPFETAGRGIEIAYRADRVQEESQVTALIEWLESVVKTIREYEGAVADTE